MESRQTYMNPRRLYTSTLCADPRWRGPYLAAALLFGIQTGQHGNGYVLATVKNAYAVGLSPMDVDRVADALVEQGYISLLDNPDDGAYRIGALRPAMELESLPRDREPDTASTGPASQWLYRETRAWMDHQARRALDTTKEAA